MTEVASIAYVSEFSAMSTELFMTDKILAPYGIFLLRITTGIALLAHSAYLKIFIFTMPGTSSFFESLGLPGWMAWATLIVEIVSGTMLIFGIKPRLGALIAVPGMSGAVWAHAGNGWLFSNVNGGWEYPFFWTCTLVALVLLGDGKFTLIPTFTRR
jgi:putative oxidoreductase